MVEEIQLSIRRLPGTEDLPLPSYMTEQAAGMDLFAAVAEDAAILPGERKLVPTGVAVALPEGVRGRGPTPERAGPETRRDAG